MFLFAEVFKKWHAQNALRCINERFIMKVFFCKSFLFRQKGAKNTFMKLFLLTVLSGYCSDLYTAMQQVQQQPESVEDIRRSILRTKLQKRMQVYAAGESPEFVSALVSWVCAACETCQVVLSSEKASDYGFRACKQAINVRRNAVNPNEANENARQAIVAYFARLYPGYAHLLDGALLQVNNVNNNNNVPPVQNQQVAPQPVPQQNAAQPGVAVNREQEVMRQFHEEQQRRFFVEQARQSEERMRRFNEESNRRAEEMRLDNQRREAENRRRDEERRAAERRAEEQRRDAEQRQRLEEQTRQTNERLRQQERQREEERRRRGW